MQAGLLRDIISIEKMTITVSQENGEQISTWSQVWRGRARVQFSSGTQIVDNNETFNAITRTVTIRTKPYLTGALSNYRIVIKGDYYRILSRDIRDGDMATIMLVELINQ